MKRTLKIALAILLGAMLALVVVGCSNTQADSSGSSSSSIQLDSSSSSDDSSSTALSNINLGNTAVVYFSATGSTADVANEIAVAANAYTFVLTPVHPYSNEDLAYNNENSRVSREHNDPNLQVVELESTTVPNWDSFDTVFIGYPIWWGEAAWPVDGFVRANDFTGKTVIPFCTSASSGIGSSATELEALAGTGTWLSGQRFASNATADAVQAWLETLS